MVKICNRSVPSLNGFKSTVSPIQKKTPNKAPSVLLCRFFRWADGHLYGRQPDQPCGAAGGDLLHRHGVGPALPGQGEDILPTGPRQALTRWCFTSQASTTALVLLVLSMLVFFQMVYLSLNLIRRTVLSYTK